MLKKTGFEIGGEFISPGSSRTVDLPVSSLSDHCPSSEFLGQIAA